MRRTTTSTSSRSDSSAYYSAQKSSTSTKSSYVSSAKSDSSAFWSAAHDNAVNIAKTTQSKSDSSAYYSAAKDTAAASGGYDYYYVPEVRQTSSGGSNYYTGSAYDANGNSTGFFNSSYDAGSAPSVDAPTIRDATEAEIAKCSNGAKKANTLLTQKDLENALIKAAGKNGTVNFSSGNIDYTYLETQYNLNVTFKNALKSSKSKSSDSDRLSLLPVGRMLAAIPSEYSAVFSVGGIIAASEPTPAGEIVLGIGLLSVALIEAIKSGNNRKTIDYDDFELPDIFVFPLPELKKGYIETLPTDEEKKGDNVETMPTDNEEKGNNTESLPLPEENKDLIVEAEEVTSPNQMQQQINRGKAPKGVERVDKGNTAVGSEAHVHFGDDYQSLNIDGTWGHEGGKKIPTLSNEIINWLKDNGWGIPEGY